MKSGCGGDLGAAVAALDAALPELARAVIRSHLNLDLVENQVFLAEPDDRAQHQSRWHQWGIISHTREFLRHFREDIPSYLRDWGVGVAAGRVLDERIDGATKRELLPASILLHDIGKFGARTAGSDTFHFWRHEQLSGIIIREELNLTHFGFTPAQAEYIAHTAEDHFVLGLLRKRAREQGVFDVAFTESAEFLDLSQGIKASHPDDFTEIGILFLGDSLAKADPAKGPSHAVGQYAANIAVARRYLQIVLGDVSL